MNTNEIAHIASLVGEPARTTMLLELMDGRALTANELAQAANITPQTASRHLSLLVDAGLLAVRQQGRHRYHQLASCEVATMLEGIMQVASLNRATYQSTIRTGPNNKSMRRARMCYDHIGGRLGVVIADHLLKSEAIIFEGDSGQVCEKIQPVLEPIGLTLNRSQVTAQMLLCKPCMDWSERRYHLAGPLGAKLCAHLLNQGWIRRREKSRALDVSAKGKHGLITWLGEQGQSLFY